MTLRASQSDFKICAGCGDEFERPARLDTMRWAARRYCSRRCGLATAGHNNQGSVGMNGAEKSARQAAIVGSRALLVRSIRYGLNHNSDLGMGREPFMECARNLGLAG